MTPEPFVVERFDEIDSTNTYLMDRSRAGAPSGLVAVADFQTAGRGRLDRRWEAPAGSCLLTSILLRAPLDHASMHLATGAVALSAVAAIEQLASRGPGIKWPNDLVFETAKVAGVLAEIDPTPHNELPGTIGVVVGIGINLTWPGPPGVGGTSIKEATGVEVGRDALLKALLVELSSRLVLLGDDEGRAALNEELLERVATIGQRVQVELADTQIVGLASGLSPEGHLIVETAEGPREVITGDVVHLRPDLPGPAQPV